MATHSDEMEQADVPGSAFGVLVRTYRHEAGLTQQELAAKARLSLAALRDIEQSRRRRPRPSSVTALADALGLDFAQRAGIMQASRAPAVAPSARQGDQAEAPDQRANGQGLWLTVLGPLRGWRNGAPVSFGPPMRQAVLGLLLLDANAGVRRDSIIDALWGEHPPRTAVNLVQAHMSRLRKSLEPQGGPADDDVLDSVGGAYRIRLSSAELDLLRFRDLTVRAASRRKSGDIEAACALYEDAVGLWHGDPLADVEGLAGHPGIASVRQELTNALMHYAELASASGQHSRVLPRLRSLAAMEPLDETVHARLMIALAGAGQQAAAIDVYEVMRSRLDREFGLYPGADLTEAHLRVLRQEISTRSAPRPAPGAPVRFASRTVPRQLPASTRHFTGRDQQLNVLNRLLAQNPADVGAATILAITGMAGVGKTALAIHWAHQVADQFPDGQLFVNLQGFGPFSEPVTRTKALAGMLAGLGVPDGQLPADASGRTALLRSLLAERRMLIVLDNALDAEQARPLLPGSPGCRTLVTSRNRLTGLAAGEGAHLLALDCLTEEESRGLLTRSLGPRVVAEPSASTELVGLCAGLPVALCSVIARAAARPNLPLAALAAGVRGRSSRLDALETGEAGTSVRVVLSWSLARLTDRAARLLRLLGVHVGPEIGVLAAASLAGLPRTEVEAALGELSDGHLITEYAPQRYLCHDLLRAYAAEAARLHDGETARREAVHRVLDHYTHTADTAAALLYPDYVPLPLQRSRDGVACEEISDPTQAAAWFEAERQTLLAAITTASAGGYTPQDWALPWAAGPFLRTTRDWRELITEQESALAAAITADDAAGGRWLTARSAPIQRHWTVDSK